MYAIVHILLRLHADPKTLNIMSQIAPFPLYSALLVQGIDCNLAFIPMPFFLWNLVLPVAQAPLIFLQAKGIAV